MSQNNGGRLIGEILLFIAGFVLGFIVGAR